MKISPATSPSGTPSIWVMGSKNVFVADFFFVIDQRTRAHRRRGSEREKKKVEKLMDGSEEEKMSCILIVEKYFL